MKEIYKIIIGLALITFAAPSCKTALDLEPVSSITVASFWKTESDAQAGANAMYHQLRLQATNQGNQYNTFFLGEARSDVFVTGTAAPLFNLYYENLLTPISAGPSWQGYYTIINSANLVLKYVPGITFSSEAVKNQLLAEAYTMRAYVYFLMTKSWGDLIIRTEPIEGYDPTTGSLSERLPKEAVFSLIKSDLDKAIQLYPNNSFATGRGKWSKPAANAVKAEVYLWTGKQLNGGTPDFNVALAAINELQTAAPLSLLPNFADVFSYGNKGNNEIIMAIRLADGEGATGYTNYSYGMSIPGCTPQADKDAIGVQNPGTISNHNWQLSPAIRNAFTDDDQRKRATFIDLYTYNAQCVQTGYSGTVTMKFKGTVISSNRAFLDDVIIFRLADILLMKAEVKNALLQDPAFEINEVRKRAYGVNYPAHVFVSGAPAQNDNAILNERLLELVVEGKRWWDLVRFGKAYEKVASLGLETSDPNHTKLLFPISNAILALEPKVVQNPGY
jgi:hypothetical protein